MSPRPTCEHAHERTDMITRIKAVARQQMAEHGTAGLSLRGIAREMGITAPAIYNYFPRLDDLITALIVDAFTALADAMEAAESAVESERALGRRSWHSCLAYREWAIAHPVDLPAHLRQPHPRLRAPEEITIPLARRPFHGVFRWFLAPMPAGELTIPADTRPCRRPWLPASRLAPSGHRVPDPLLGLLMSGWARIHGADPLELFGHLQPLVGARGPSSAMRWRRLPAPELGGAPSHDQAPGGMRSRHLRSRITHGSKDL